MLSHQDIYLFGLCRRILLENKRRRVFSCFLKDGGKGGGHGLSVTPRDWENNTVRNDLGKVARMEDVTQHFLNVLNYQKLCSVP